MGASGNAEVERNCRVVWDSQAEEDEDDEVDGKDEGELGGC